MVGNDSSRLKWLAKHYMVHGYATFNAATETAIKSGAVRQLPVRDVTNIIVGACVLPFTLSRRLKGVNGELPTGEEAVTSLGDTLLEVLFKGLDARPRP